LLYFRYSEEIPQVPADCGGFVFELGVGEAGDAIAGDVEVAVALAVVAEGGAGAVALPAIELHDLALCGPEAVDLEPPPSHFQPGVELRSRQAVAVQEWEEQFL
jgi:hypothetical protein